jgi:AraC family transcriptional regulator
MILLLMADGSRYGPAFGEQLGLALAVYLFERCCVTQPKKSGNTSRLPGKTLQKLLSYIDERIGFPITVEELARHIGISRFYFARLFRNTTGRPGQYILDRRMEHARRLVEKRVLSLREVALATGFVRQSHFASVFRFRNGFTPSQYRLMLS